MDIQFEEDVVSGDESDNIVIPGIEEDLLEKQEREFRENIKKEEIKPKKEVKSKKKKIKEINLKGTPDEIKDQIKKIDKAEKSKKLTEGQQNRISKDKVLSQCTDDAIDLSAEDDERKIKEWKSRIRREKIDIRNKRYSEIGIKLLPYPTPEEEEKLDREEVERTIMEQAKKSLEEHQRKEQRNMEEKLGLWDDDKLLDQNREKLRKEFEGSQEYITQFDSFVEDEIEFYKAGDICSLDENGKQRYKTGIPIEEAREHARYYMKGYVDNYILRKLGIREGSEIREDENSKKRQIEYASNSLASWFTYRTQRLMEKLEELLPRDERFKEELFQYIIPRRMAQEKKLQLY